MTMTDSGVALADTQTTKAADPPAVVMPSVTIMHAKPIYRCQTCGQTGCAGHLPRESKP